MDDGLRDLIPEVAEFRDRNHDAVEAWSINPNEPYKQKDTSNGWTQETFEAAYSDAFTAVNPNTIFFGRKDPYGLQFQTMPTFRSTPPLRYPNLTTLPGLLDGQDDAIAEMERDILMDDVAIGDQNADGRPRQLVEGVNARVTGEAVDMAVMKDKAQPAEYS
jgi:hypothetical protein